MVDLKQLEQQTTAEIRILRPRDVLDTLASIDEKVTTTILDPWYNKGVGGVRDDYHSWLSRVVSETARVSEHIFVWVLTCRQRSTRCQAPLTLPFTYPLRS